jgi:hypothetical protein
VRHRSRLLLFGVALTGVLLVARWSYELPRLLLDQGPTGALDLRMRHAAVQHWFAGEPVYAPNVVPMPYPPASQAILWPFLGWLDFAPARWFWAFTLLASLAWLTTLVVRESGVRGPLERLLIAVFVPTTYAVCITVGNGQLGVHVLALLLWALLLVRRGIRSWTRDLLIGGLFAFSLVKPSLSAPFFWILLLDRSGLRPAALAATFYGGLTFLAAAFRPEGVVELLRMWMSQSADAALGARYGYANLHQWMSGLGMSEWIPQGSLLVLLLLGAWLWRHRRGPLWPLMGVTAVVARIWTYHAQYDDLLVFVPLVALLGLSRRGTLDEARTVLSTFLLILGCLAALAPARLLAGPPPWDVVFRAGQVLLWTAMLALLAATTARSPDDHEAARPCREARPS